MIKISTIPALVILLLITLAYATYLQQSSKQKKTTEPQPFCGYTNPSSKSIKTTSKENPNSTITEQIGKSLFKANCASCHAKDMKTKLTGPALGGVENRWAKYPREDLYNYIRNSQRMLKDKHPEALEIWKEWQPAIMNDFPNLTDDDIESLLLYIEMDYYH